MLTDGSKYCFIEPNARGYLKSIFSGSLKPKNILFLIQSRLNAEIVINEMSCSIVLQSSESSKFSTAPSSSSRKRYLHPTTAKLRNRSSTTNEGSMMTFEELSASMPLEATKPHHLSHRISWHAPSTTSFTIGGDYHHQHHQPLKQIAEQPPNLLTTSTPM